MFRLVLILISATLITQFTESFRFKCEKTKRPACYTTRVDFDEFNETYFKLNTRKNPNDIEEVSFKLMSSFVKRIPTEIFKDYPNIAVLNLKLCDLTTLDGMSQALKVRDLTIEDNMITEIKEGQLGPMVQDLQASKNNISSIEENALKSVTHLELAYNQLQSLPTNVFNKNIRTILLQHNLLQNVDGLFNGLSKLTDLDISNNRIRHLSENAFDSCTELNYLKIASNQLDTIPKNLFDKLVKLRKVYLNDNALKVLDLHVNCANCLINAENNQLTEVTLNTKSNRAIVVFLELDNNAIRKVDLGNHILLSELHLKKNQLAELNVVMEQNKLTLVDLSYNDLSRIGVEYFKKMKFANNMIFQSCSLTSSQVKEIFSLPKKKWMINVSYNPSVGSINWKDLSPNQDVYGLEVDACHIATVDENEIKRVFPHLDRIVSPSDNINCREAAFLDVNLKSVNIKYILD